MDIVERLNERTGKMWLPGEFLPQIFPDKLCREAAAEITRLRAIEARYLTLTEDYASLHKEAARLRALVAEAERAKADAWDEGYWAGHSDGASNRTAPDNPYRSKTDD